MHVTLDASFWESEPYYFGGAYGPSLQGESNHEENEGVFEVEENGGLIERNIGEIYVAPNIQN